MADTLNDKVKKCRWTELGELQKRSAVLLQLTKVRAKLMCLAAVFEVDEPGCVIQKLRNL